MESTKEKRATLHAEIQQAQDVIDGLSAAIAGIHMFHTFFNPMSAQEHAQVAEMEQQIKAAQTRINVAKDLLKALDAIERASESVQKVVEG